MSKDTAHGLMANRQCNLWRHLILSTLDTFQQILCVVPDLSQNSSQRKLPKYKDCIIFLANVARVGNAVKIHENRDI